MFRRSSGTLLHLSSLPGPHGLGDLGPAAYRFADFLQRFGALAAAARTPEETTQMARLFWFTVEFGLIRERGDVRIYGSGLISSHGDAAHALGPAVERRPFSLQAVIDQPFEIDRFQDVLFVVEHFDQLFEAVELLTSRQRNSA